MILIRTPLRTLQADFIQQRIGDCLFCSIDSPGLALGLACAHHGLAHLLHHRAHIGEIEIDHAGPDHQVGHALHALVENVISHLKGLDKCRAFRCNLEQVLVRNDDQRVDHRLH